MMDYTKILQDADRTPRGLHEAILRIAHVASQYHSAFVHSTFNTSRLALVVSTAHSYTDAVLHAVGTATSVPLTRNDNILISLIQDVVTWALKNENSVIVTHSTDEHLCLSMKYARVSSGPPILCAMIHLPATELRSLIVLLKGDSLMPKAALDFWNAQVAVDDRAYTDYVRSPWE